MTTTVLVPTDETMTFAEARLIYDIEPDEDLPEVISVCDGEYRKGPDGYEWWANQERTEH